MVNADMFNSHLPKLTHTGNTLYLHILLQLLLYFSVISTVFFKRILYMNLTFLSSPPPFIVSLLQSGCQSSATTETVTLLSIDICVGISTGQILVLNL